MDSLNSYIRNRL